MIVASGAMSELVLFAGFWQVTSANKADEVPRTYPKLSKFLKQLVLDIGFPFCNFDPKNSVGVNELTPLSHEPYSNG